MGVNASYELKETEIYLACLCSEPGTRLAFLITKMKLSWFVVNG